MRIYAVRFFSWAAWSVFFSFMSLWLLKGEFFDAAQVGSIAATAALANRAGALVFAPWINRTSVRRAVTISQIGVIASTAVMVALEAARVAFLPWWLAASLIFGLSCSIATLAQVTYIARHFSASENLKAFSYENVALNLSAGLSPLLSSVLLERHTPMYGFAPILFGLVSIALIAGIAPAGAEQEPPPEAETARDTTSRLPRKIVFIALNFLIFFAFTLFYNVFPVYAKEAMSVEQIGLMFAASSALIVLLQIPTSRLAARHKAVTLAMLSNACMALGIVGLYFSVSHVAAACGAIVLLTLSEIIFGPLYQSMSIKVFAGKPAFAMSILMLVWALAETAATMIGIKLVSQGDARWMFGLAAAGCVVAMIILAIQHRKTRDGSVAIAGWGKIGG